MWNVLIRLAFEQVQLTCLSFLMGENHSTKPVCFPFVLAEG